MKSIISGVILALVFAFPQMCNANNNNEVVQVSLSESGDLTGHVFAMMEDEKAPIAGKVSLTLDGKTVSTLETDETGNFSFKDVRPGKYEMIGVAGEYIGNKVIEVTPFKNDSDQAGEYTAIPLMVAPSYSPAQVFDSYGAAPAQVFSGGMASNYVGGFSTGGCSTCGGGGGFGGGGLGGGRLLNFRRLALIGGTVGLAVGLSGPSSPDE